MQIIGLAGRAGSGKSEAAKIIASCYPDGACRVLPFAAPLKELCSTGFGWDGAKDARGRRLLQVVGTDAGRAYNPNIWVEKWTYAALHSSYRTKCIIADDVRFENECEAVRSLGGVVWRIDRPDTIATGKAPRDDLVSLLRDVTKLDTSQDCDPINHGLVVRAMDWLEANETHVSEMPLPANLIDATVRNNGSIQKLHYVILERIKRLLEGGRDE